MCYTIPIRSRLDFIFLDIRLNQWEGGICYSA